MVPSVACNSTGRVPSTQRGAQTGSKRATRKASDSSLDRPGGKDVSERGLQRTNAAKKTSRPEGTLVMCAIISWNTNVQTAYRTTLGLHGE